MYIKPAYEERELAVLHRHMTDWSFATLISHSDAGLQVTHLPFLLDPAKGALGTLTTHIARANPHGANLHDGGRALVVFNGPHAFVSPSWYRDQMTFPTWNYAAIHASVTLSRIDDPERIRAILHRTVAQYDTPVGGNWSFDAMPEAMIAPRLGAIAGLELDITHLEGKFKLNQDRSAEDRQGVIDALLSRGDTYGHTLAELMRSREPR